MTQPGCHTAGQQGASSVSSALYEASLARAEELAKPARALPQYAVTYGSYECGTLFKA